MLLSRSSAECKQCDLRHEIHIISVVDHVTYAVCYKLHDQ